MPVASSLPRKAGANTHSKKAKTQSKKQKAKQQQQQQQQQQQPTTIRNNPLLAKEHVMNTREDLVIQSIGDHPAKNTMRLLGVVGAFILVLIALSAPFGLKVMGTVAYLGCMLFGLVAIFCLGALITAWINNGTYQKARAAIVKGEITPDFAGHDGLANGIFLIDSKQRRLYVNGELRDFAELRNLRTGFDGRDPKRVKHYLEFVWKSGAKPISRVHVASDAAKFQSFERLNNLLNFG